MELEQLRAYLAVVDEKSFNKAADVLGVPRRTLRRQIDALESEMGSSLLVRTPGGTAPTERGLELARGAADVLRRAADLQRARSEEEIVGEIRVAYPVGLPAEMHCAFFAAVTGDRPGLFLSASTHTGPHGAAMPDADLVLAFTLGPPPAGPFRTFVVARTTEKLVAHSSYLREHGIPSTIEDLKGHRLLSWRPPGEDPRVWMSKDGRSVKVEPFIVCDEAGTVREMAIQGVGVARFPTLSPALLAEAGLVEVLPEVFERRVDVRAFMPEVSASTPRVRLAVEVTRRVASQWMEDEPAS